MATVIFLYRSIKPEAYLTARLLFSVDKKEFSIDAKTNILTQERFYLKQYPKKKLKDIDLANKKVVLANELNKIENHILKAFNEIDSKVLVQRSSKEKKAWLISIIDLYYNPITDTDNIPNSLIEYFDYYLEYRKNELTETSLKKYKVVKQLLIRFQEHRRKVIYIKDVNDRFKNEYMAYCINEKYAQNTIQRSLTTIKTVCKHARYHGIETHVQLDELKIEREKVDHIYLDNKEIEQIEKTIMNERLTNAKDWLIISCNTGQRVSDFMRFKSNNIKVEKIKEKGVEIEKSFIEFTQKKTGKIMCIPLNDKVMSILERRNGEFPVPLSDIKYNEYLKEVCKEAKITEKVNGSKKCKTIDSNGKTVYRKTFGLYHKWELVSSHIGRRSFATNFLGLVPTSHLIYMTGHSTEAMFLSYIGKTDKDKALEVAKYF